MCSCSSRTSARPRRRKEDGRPKRDRVDRGDLESGDGLRQGLAGLRPLLRRDVRRALARRSRPSLRAGLRPAAMAGAAGAAAAVEAAAHDLRQLDERPVPRADPGRLRRATSSTSWPRRHWHTFQVLTKRHERLPSSAPSSPGRRTSGWASRSRTGASCSAPTACARSPPPCASSPPSRCSGRSTASTSTGIDWLIAGGESGHGTPVRPRVGARPPRPLRRRGRRVLLQAVGWPDAESGGRVLDGRTWDEMPEPRVRDVLSYRLGAFDAAGARTARLDEQAARA